MEIEKIVEEIVSKIGELSSESEFTLNSFLSEYKLDDESSLQVTIEVVNKLGSKIASKGDDAVMSLPQNIVYVVK